jgi:type IV pilus assembly protein PilQ
MVVDLFKSSPYQTEIDGDTVRIKIANGSVRSAGAVDNTTGLELANLDFRRGKNGEGRVILSFSGDGAGADLRREGDKLIIDVPNARLGSGLNQRYDVLDFATPVESIEARAAGGGTRVTVNVAAGADPIAYQAGSEYVVEVSAKKAEVSAARKALEPAKYSGARVTFSFQDIPVRSLLQLVADVSEQNVAVSDSVAGNITLRLIDVPWDQALDIILQAKGLDKRRNGNVIWIAPTKEIADREQALEDARIALEERAPLVSDFLPINYGKAEDIAKLLTEESLKSEGSGGVQNSSGNQGFLSPRGSVSFDERTNTLLLNDTAVRIASVRELVGLLDRPVEQVLIESRIVVANDDFARALGARFGVSGAAQDSDRNVISVGGTLGATDTLSSVALGNRLNRTGSALPVGVPGGPGEGIQVPRLIDRLNVNLPVTSAAGSFGLTVLAEDYLLDLELSALQTEGRGEVISSPRVITASQREALIRQGTEVPYTASTIDQQTGAITQNVQFKQVVLELKVTPTISPDQRIFMNLEVKQDSLADLAVNGQPAINTRNINTAVLVDNGQTVVLGGILERIKREDTSKVPYLGDLPGVGNLFKRRSREDQKQELLIFVTPKILDTSLR